jgi:tetratricopeptide (TPR) repeat protein
MIDSPLESPTKRRSSHLWVLLLLCAMFAIGIWIFTRSAGALKLPRDPFPEGISTSLRSELMEAIQRVERNPKATTWGALGELYMAHELLPPAKHCFQNASTENPQEPKWNYLLGMIAEEINIAEALEAYQKAAQMDSSSPSLYLRLGKLQSRAGQFSAAERSLKTASDLSKEHPLVLKSMAQLLAMQDKTEAATIVYRKICLDDRSGQDLLSEAGQWFHRYAISQSEPTLSQRNQIAPHSTEPLPEPWFNGVLAHIPRAAAIAAQAGMLASNQQYDAAFTLYSQLVRSESRNSRSHAFRAMVLMNAGAVDQARSEINRVCETFPGDALAWTCKGAIEAKIADYESATSSLKKAVSLKPDYLEAHRALLMMYKLREMPTEIAGQYQILLNLSPSDTDLRADYEKFAAETGSRND